jgi:hypothetical protein
MEALFRKLKSGRMVLGRRTSPHLLQFVPNKIYSAQQTINNNNCWFETYTQYFLRDFWPPTSYILLRESRQGGRGTSKLTSNLMFGSILTLKKTMYTRLRTCMPLRQCRKYAPRLLASWLWPVEYRRPLGHTLGQRLDPLHPGNYFERRRTEWVKPKRKICQNLEFTSHGQNRCLRMCCPSDRL